jgi:2-oxo-hept-3-ene-1,7-dioate hydratase
VTGAAAIASGMRALLAARERELAAGASPLGWKIGINMPALQERMGIDAPVVGSLTTATQLAPGDTVAVGEATRPVLEPEIAIRVGPSNSVGAVAPALELVDINLPFDNVEPILAGNVMHRGVVLGEPQPPGSAAGAGVRVLRDGSEEAAADFVDDPAEVARYVAGFLATHGAVLEVGDWIIAGSLTTPVPVAPGDAIEADFGPLGSLALRFVS